jgi:anti-anti-sigma factor
MTVLDFAPRADVPARLGVAPLLAGTRVDLRAEADGDVTLVAVWGELCAGTVDGLTRLVDESIRAGRVHVVLDLRRLFDLDADAIAELVRLRNLLTERSGGLWLTDLRPWVRRLLDHMVAKATFAVCPTTAAALARIRGDLSTETLPQWA